METTTATLTIKTKTYTKIKKLAMAKNTTISKTINELLENGLNNETK